MEIHKKTTISVSTKTKSIIDANKLCPDETYDNCLKRIIQEASDNEQ